MKNPPHTPRAPGAPSGRGSRRGSIILLVLFITLTLCLAMGPLIQMTVSSAKLNNKGILTLQAKNAAESAVEFGCAQLKLRWDNQVNFPSNALQTSPLTLPSNIVQWLWGNSSVVTSSVALTGGIVPPGQWIYIDPNNPANEFDPQRGKNVFARDVMVYSTATATSTGGGAQTAYCQEALEVRDGPLFADAIFYNMDLEFHPGPAMTISGPVHSNGNIWAVAETSLTYSGPVTTSGNFNVGMIPYPTSWASYNSAETGAVVALPNGKGGNTTPYSGSGNQQVSGSYYDSRQTTFTGTGYNNWADYSSNTWAGNLQTSANGVPQQNVIGYNNFMFQVNGTSQDLNYAYAIIEPNEFNPATNPFSKGPGELYKFARQAGLTVNVLSGNVTYFTQVHTAVGTYSTSGANSTIPAALTNISNGNLSANITTNDAAITSSLVASVNSGPLSLTRPAGWSTAVMLLNQYQADAGDNNLSGNLMEVTSIAISNTTPIRTANNTLNTTNYTINYTTTRTVGYSWVGLQTLETSVSSTGLRTLTLNNSTASSDGTYPGDVIPQNVTINPAVMGNATIPGNGTALIGAVMANVGAAPGLANLLTFNPAVGNLSTLSASSIPSSSLVGNTTDMWSGLDDQHRGEALQTVSLDVGKLRAVVDSNVGTWSAAGSTNSLALFGAGNTSYNPVNQFNGVLYVQFPQLAGNTTRLNSVTSGNVTYPGDKVTDSQDGWGLVVTNASVVPNPSYNNSTQSTFPAAGRTSGFTLATNNDMYVVGHYNADGNPNTPPAPNNPATMPDNPANPDPSCALAADAINVLSPAWVNRQSGVADGTRAPATFTEFDAAMLAGIVPSMKYSSTGLSGGAHNFPRFLENWSGVNFVYRGSIVDLFESEIASQPYGSNYYSPPNRVWGYYNQFANGVYPPGTPNARSYQRVQFKFLTQAQYTAALSAL